MSGALDQTTAAPSVYVLWLDGRLEDGRDKTWFNGQPPFEATTFCRLLGQALLRRDEHEEDAFRNGVHAAGFDVARQGEAALREALDRIAASATGHLDEPNKAFGALYAGLNRDFAGEEGFAPCAAILRACVRDHWPFAARETVLGEVVTKRRLHYFVTASKGTGVGAQAIAQFLVEAGALPERDDRPPSRRLLEAMAHADLLDEIPTLAGPIAMREAMGATKHELEALAADGVLVPCTRVSKVKSPWRLSDGTVFVANLERGALPVTEDDDRWETLRLARKRTTVSLANLIQRIREGRLPLASGPVFAASRGSSFPGVRSSNSPRRATWPSREGSRILRI